MKSTIEPAQQIRPEVLYSLKDAKLVTGWGKTAFRLARERGLEVRYVAGRGYVMGSALIQHVLTAGKTVKPGAHQ